MSSCSSELMYSSEIKKAVFPVAGFGTRFLPATKAMPKELLPIIDKPLIQYAAEEAISAGIDTLIFVTGKNKRAIEDHFDSNFELESTLISKGKYKQAKMVKNILPSGVECIFVRQAEQLGLGHAVLCAERVVGKNPFLVILADDFLTGKNSNKTLIDLIKRYNVSRKSQLSVMEILGKDISKYGVIKVDKMGSVVGLVEKPDVSKAPSNLASIGRYLLTPEIFESLRSIKPKKGLELQLTDGLNILAQKGEVEVSNLNGKRFDCGSLNGYLDAVLFEAKSRMLLS